MRRTEGTYEKAYKDLKFFVLRNLCAECIKSVKSEINIIETNIKKTQKYESHEEQPSEMI